LADGLVRQWDWQTSLTADQEPEAHATVI
jgi:hypothetical protein